MLTRLVTIGEGTQDTRRRVEVGRLPNVPAHVVDIFVRQRLLTTDRNSDNRAPTVEIAHEVLLHSWPRLRRWLDEDRQWLRELRTLSVAAQQWREGGGDDADLYRGGRLAAITAHGDRLEGALNDEERAFLDASLASAAALQRLAEQRLDETFRQNRRLRRISAVLAVVVGISVLAGSLAFVQKQRADRQQRAAETQRLAAEQDRELAIGASQRADRERTGALLTTLASQSLSLRSSQRDLAALLAVEAWRRSPDATSKSALFGTFTLEPNFDGYLTFDSGGVEGVSVPGTSNMLVTIYPPTDVPIPDPPKVIDVLTGESLVKLEAATDFEVLGYDFAVSPNGKFGAAIVTPWEDDVAAGQAPVRGSVVAGYDLSTGSTLGPTIKLPTLWYAVAIDNSGTRLAAASGVDGETAVSDVASGRELTRIPTLADSATSPYGRDGGALAFGPDGRLYVGSRGDRLRIFDPSTLVQVDEIVVPAYATSGVLRFNRDGTTLVARGIFEDATNPVLTQLGSIARIDVANRQVVWDVSGADFGYGDCAAFAFPSQPTDCGAEIIPG